jgi:hypothetical protein
LKENVLVIAVPKTGPGATACEKIRTNLNVRSTDSSTVVMERIIGGFNCLIYPGFEAMKLNPAAGPEEHIWDDAPAVAVVGLRSNLSCSAILTKLWAVGRLRTAAVTAVYISRGSDRVAPPTYVRHTTDVLYIMGVDLFPRDFVASAPGLDDISIERGSIRILPFAGKNLRDASRRMHESAHKAWCAAHETPSRAISVGSHPMVTSPTPTTELATLQQGKYDELARQIVVLSEQAAQREARFMEEMHRMEERRRAEAVELESKRRAESELHDARRRQERLEAEQARRLRDEERELRDHESARMLKQADDDRRREAAEANLKMREEDRQRRADELREASKAQEKVVETMELTTKLLAGQNERGTEKDDVLREMVTELREARIERRMEKEKAELAARVAASKAEEEARAAEDSEASGSARSKMAACTAEGGAAARPKRATKVIT